MIGSGLLDQTVSLAEYVDQLIVGKEVFDQAGLSTADNGSAPEEPEDPFAKEKGEQFGNKAQLDAAKLIKLGAAPKADPTAPKPVKPKKEA